MKARTETVAAENKGAAPGARGGETIVIEPLATEADVQAFRMLNEEWITRYFALEAKDRATLGDPQTKILDKGGRIFMVRQAGETVGCVALIAEGDGVYELSKMAVAPGMRGLGIGRRLLEYTIAQAKALGARALYLGSSRKLPNAVHLYESVGFVHVAPDKLPPAEYTRADVFMELQLALS